MAMLNSLRSKIVAAIGGGSIAVAAALIPSLEGVEYKPYQDVVGVWTVCYGHTGKDIVIKKTYSEAECQLLLTKDLSTTARQIDPYIKVNIPASTHGALYSFAYNVGSSAFIKSTMLKKLNAGDTAGACAELRKWTYAGGKQWKGLVNRREIEKEVCDWGVK